MPIPGPTCNWNSSRRRPTRPHVFRPADSTTAGNRGSAAPASAGAARVSLVSQAHGAHFHSLLYRTGRISIAVSMDRVLGPQLLLGAGPGVALFLGQRLRPRR